MLDYRRRGSNPQYQVDFNEGTMVTASERPTSYRIGARDAQACAMPLRHFET